MGDTCRAPVAAAGGPRRGVPFRSLHASRWRLRCGSLVQAGRRRCRRPPGDPGHGPRRNGRGLGPAGRADRGPPGSPDGSRSMVAGSRRLDRGGTGPARRPGPNVERTRRSLELAANRPLDRAGRRRGLAGLRRRRPAVRTVRGARRQRHPGRPRGPRFSGVGRAAARRNRDGRLSGCSPVRSRRAAGACRPGADRALRRRAGPGDRRLHRDGMHGRPGTDRSGAPLPEQRPRDGRGLRGERTLRRDGAPHARGLSRDDPVASILMTYWPWLLAISVAFVFAERLIPWRRGQALLRPGWMRDLGFLAVNGYFFSLWTGTLNGVLAAAATSALQAWGLGLAGSPVPRWPFAAQVAVLLLLGDFLQWCVHNLLHRVPFLWTFHKVHHSIATMDWIGNWRFHWMEILVYKGLQWLPLAWLGASPSSMFAVAVVTTVWGDLNHANLDVGLGPLGRVLNSPRMHL